VLVAYEPGSVSIIFVSNREIADPIIFQLNGDVIGSKRGELRER
jgi:hypothetical protein